MRLYRQLWWIPLFMGLATLAVGWNTSPSVRLLLSTWLLLSFVKAATLLKTEVMPHGWGFLLYATVWPGPDPSGLREMGEPLSESGRRFRRGYAKFLSGVLSVLLVAWFSPLLSAGWTGALGIAALLLTVHLGFSDMLTGGLQSQGFAVKPLFNDPLASRTLNEFWTRRWNLAFVQMNRILFFEPIAKRWGMKRAVFGVFLISGLLHEMAISYPVMKGWGGPLLYFALQAVSVLMERRFRLQGPWWTWSMILLPLPLLFHEAFRVLLVAPLFFAIGEHLHRLTFTSFWSAALLVLGLLHFLILGASAQVPSRLNWREELNRLSPLNRKLMWTYGIFIVLCIVSFGIMTLALRHHLLEGQVSGLWLCGFIAIFWALRLVVDNTILSHDDWPQGPQFEIGHTLLTTVFLILTAGYGGFLFFSVAR